jgi:1-deoxy-D-xylulose-5-phosphate synthase
VVDGHDQAAVERGLRALSGSPGPAVLHVRTVKGCGYPPAEADQAKKLHDIGPFDPATARSTRPGGPTYTEAFSAALLAEAGRRPEVVAITAAMGGPTGLDGFAGRYPERFCDVGIAEQHAVGTAAGMALGGLRPVVAIYSTFLNRAWDQIYFDVGLHRLPVVFCIDRAGITGEDGPSHHGLLDLALLSKVPGMTVLTPSCAGDLGPMLHHALEITTGPVAIRWPKGEAPISPARTPIGDAAGGHGGPVRARQLRQGDRLCLVGFGKMVDVCLDAAAILADAGIEATVWDAQVAVPVDAALLDDAARHQVVVTAEDGVVEGGVGALLAAAIGRIGTGQPGPRVVPCGVPVAYLAHGRVGEILAHLGLDGPGISATALGALSGCGPLAAL